MMNHPPSSEEAVQQGQAKTQQHPEGHDEAKHHVTAEPPVVPNQDEVKSDGSSSSVNDQKNVTNEVKEIKKEGSATDNDNETEDKSTVEKNVVGNDELSSEKKSNVVDAPTDDNNGDMTENDVIVASTCNESSTSESDKNPEENVITTSPEEQNETMPIIDDTTPLQNSVSPRDAEISMLGGEVIFERQPNKASYNGWDTLRWMAHSGDRKLIYCGPVSRFVAARRGLFWSGDQYLERIIAVYEQPSLILILRKPKDFNEINEILDNSSPSISSDKKEKPKSYLIVDSVVDSKTSKLRLSLLTTCTSISDNEIRDDDFRRQSCFDLVTPSETISLSAIQLKSGAERALTSFDDTEAVAVTSRMESALDAAICDSHSVDHQTGNITDLSWKHQIILGTLHSFVVLGNQTKLNKALARATQYFNNDQSQNNNNNNMGTTKNDKLVDAVDDNGYSALHYACLKRSFTAVSLLIKAGARVDVPCGPFNSMPCHLCCHNLDHKSLAAILEAHPNAHTLDNLGRTPLYIAAIFGRVVGGRRDASALRECLVVLDKYGAKVDKASHQQHPISTLAHEWFADELSVILDFAWTRYPLPSSGSNDKSLDGISLGGYYQYPIHAALISFRLKLADENNAQKTILSLQAESPSNCALLRTIRVLIEHGFEPNERLEGLAHWFDGGNELLKYVGYAPIQILASTGLDIVALESRMEKRHHLHLVQIISDITSLLVKNGARLSLDAPPKSRGVSRNCAFLTECSGDGDFMASLYDRSLLQVEGNKDLETIMQLKNMADARLVWNALKSVDGGGGIFIRTDKIIPNSEAPNGSDETNCAICWKVFGRLMNRRHMCRVSRRYVCDECSSKRVVVNGEEHRISDGQFVRCLVDSSKHESLRLNQIKLSKQVKTDNIQVSTSRSSNSFRSEGTDHSSSNDDSFNRNILFGGVMDNVASAVFGNKEEETTQNEINGLTAKLGQTKDALNQRGQKLNSLAEKSDELVNASKNFADMAKQLNDSTKNRGLFW